MILKILFLFFTLMLIIFGIIEAVQLDNYLEDYDEEPVMLISGGVMYVVAWVVALVYTIEMIKGDNCDCVEVEMAANAVIHSTNIMFIGACLFVEPFIRYFVDKIQGIDR